MCVYVYVYVYVYATSSRTISRTRTPRVRREEVLDARVRRQRHLGALLLVQRLERLHLEHLLATGRRRRAARVHLAAVRVARQLRHLAGGGELERRACTRTRTRPLLS